MSRDRQGKDRSSVDHVAAEWAVRKDRGLTPAEQDEFLQWLAADRTHAEWFARHQATWLAFDGLRPLPVQSKTPAPGRTLAPDEPARQKRFGWTKPGLLAAALLLGLSVALWRAPSATRQPAAVVVAAENNTERRVLEDGSVVHLNRGTLIEARFTAADRQIAMDHGEAHFKVAKNAQRPFIVRAEGVQVRAVGTAFNVKLGENSVDVFVDEGRVQVTHAGADGRVHETFVAAGERAIVSLNANTAPAVTAVSASDAAQLLDWHSKLLDFASVPLSQVAAEFNRYNDVQLVLADPELGRMPIVATMRSDNVEAFARLLELSGKVRVERAGRTLRLWSVP